MRSSSWRSPFASCSRALFRFDGMRQPQIPWRRVAHRRSYGRACIDSRAIGCTSACSWRSRPGRSGFPTGLVFSFLPRSSRTSRGIKSCRRSELSPPSSVRHSTNTRRTFVGGSEPSRRWTNGRIKSSARSESRGRHNMTRRRCGRRRQYRTADHRTAHRRAV